MLSKVESIYIGVIIGPVLPIILFLAGWWTSLNFVTDQTVFVFGLIGFGIGCIVDIIFFRRITKAYWWKQRVLVIVYLFYSVCVFGFFMGVPIFNLAVGAIASVFMGRRFYHLGVTRERFQKAATSFGIFAASIMVLISLASAYFAVIDIRDTALNLRGMFKLPFVPTDEMIIGLIVVGGTGLVLIQYCISSRLFQWAYRIGNKT